MNNKLNDIYIATFSGKAEETASRYGFGIELNDLCISGNLESEKKSWVINKMTEELKRANALDRKTIMHGPFTELTPSAIDSRAIDLMVDRYKATIDICREMGINDLVLHDGFIPLIYQKPWHLKRSIKFWSEFAPEIPSGFTVYIENVFDDEPNLLCEIVEGVNRSLKMEEGQDKYKICLDIGHANAMHPEKKTESTEIVLKWIKTMGKLIGHFHLHNNDGTGDQHDDINKGTFDIDRVLEAIDEFCHPDVTMTIESRQAEPSAEYLFNYYR